MIDLLGIPEKKADVEDDKEEWTEFQELCPKTQNNLRNLIRQIDNTPNDYELIKVLILYFLNAYE